MEQSFKLKTKTVDGKAKVWDMIRKCWVAFTPEEGVRQQLIHYLVTEKIVPAGLIAVEYCFSFENGKPQRADVLIFDRHATPLMLIECKSPSVEINRPVFDQAARYNAFIKAAYIAVTNGKTLYCCRETDGKYHFLNEIPSYSDMLK